MFYHFSEPSNKYSKYVQGLCIGSPSVSRFPIHRTPLSDISSTMRNKKGRCDTHINVIVSSIDTIQSQPSANPHVTQRKRSLAHIKENISSTTTRQYTRNNGHYPEICECSNTKHDVETPSLVPLFTPNTHRFTHSKYISPKDTTNDHGTNNDYVTGNNPLLYT